MSETKAYAHAFLLQNGKMRDLDGKMRDLGPDSCPWYAINSRGQAIGARGSEWDTTPLLWQNGKRTTPPLLPGHNLGDDTWSLNERGQIVGYSGTEAHVRGLLRSRIRLNTGR